MTIHKAKSSDYNDLSNTSIYDYMLYYSRQISTMLEPEENGTGNSRKAKLDEIQRVDRTILKACAAELETVVKRLEYGLYGKY